VERDVANPIDAVASPAAIASTTELFPPTIRVEAPIEAVEEVVTVSEKVKKVVWIEPSEPGGSFTCMVRDEDDNILAMAEHQDWQEALLAIAEDLTPERET
jgi:hypothetical protein